MRMLLHDPCRRGSCLPIGRVIAPAMSIDSISLISGPTPIIIVGLGLGATALSLRWKDGVWKHAAAVRPAHHARAGRSDRAAGRRAGADPVPVPELVLPLGRAGGAGARASASSAGGASATGAGSSRSCRCVLSAAMAVDPDQQAVPVLPDGRLAASGSTPRTRSVLSNCRRSATGRGVSTAARYPRTASPSRSPIPGKESGFVARDAFVWVPPVWVADEKVKLPVIELLIGTPGEPSDWTRAAMADVTAREFADAHHGHGAHHRDARRERLVQRRHRMRQLGAGATRRPTSPSTCPTSCARTSTRRSARVPLPSPGCRRAGCAR